MNINCDEVWIHLYLHSNILRCPWNALHGIFQQVNQYLDGYKKLATYAPITPLFSKPQNSISIIYTKLSQLIRPMSSQIVSIFLCMFKVKFNDLHNAVLFIFWYHSTHTFLLNGVVLVPFTNT